MVGGHAGINTSLNPRVGKELQNQRMDRYKWIGHSLRPYPLSVFAMYLDLIDFLFFYDILCFRGDA